MSGDSRLNGARRAAELAWATDGRTVDLVVIGLGITGAGVALDAASRGLSVVAIDAHDLAYGTSRWSSKLAHGGLRYLAHLEVGIAHESAVERGILMQHTAPHLTHARPWLTPLTPATSRRDAVLDRTAYLAGDLLRRAARTPGTLLPAPHRIPREATLAIAPGVTRRGLRGGILAWDCQLTDDARLVVAVARTAAAQGARVLTRVRALSATGTAVSVRDELTGGHGDITARTVINATGVWAGDLAPEVRLRPSRGTHLVVRSSALGGDRAVLCAPVPGTVGRFVFTLPQHDGRSFIGLTDQPVDGHPDDVPEPGPGDTEFLLRTINQVLQRPLTPADVIGRFAGLRPLLAATGSTADISRRHAVLTSDSGLVTIVGGKLTTYRRMAQDAVDHAIRLAGLRAGGCRTARLPLVGAAPRPQLRRLDAPARLVARYGTEAAQVARMDEAGEPAAPGLRVTAAELAFGVTHEGAMTVGDLLDRRTRVGLVPADREAALGVANDTLQRLV